MISHNLTRTTIRIAAMCKTVWLALIVVAFMLTPGRAGAQNVVTPTLLPAPPGKLTIVNNSPGFQDDPHVSGNLVSYSSAVGSGPGAVFAVHYFDLSTGLDAGIPQGSNILDFLSDVSGSTVVFNRVSPNSSSVFSFDTATTGAQPVEVSPPVQAFRTSPQIGGNTIAWEDHGIVSSAVNGAIIAYDISTGATTLLSNDPTVNQRPAVSPDGSVVTWEKCANPGAPCDIWSATGGGTTWVMHQLTNGNGACTHPDNNGQIVVYSCDRGSGDQLFWQPATGGTEVTLAPVLANESTPAIAGHLVSFAGLAPGAPNHDLYVLDLSTLNLYQITNTPSADEQLNDISIAPNGNVNVAWQWVDPTNTGQYNVYAYTFSLPVGDFNLGAISPLTIAAGGSGSTNVAANPVNGFSSAVNLSVTGQPAGVTATLTPSQVTPSGGNPASSVLNVSVADFVSPANITLTVTGASGSQTHSATTNVTVTSTTSSITNLIGDLLAAGCIDNAGIGNALTSKLAAR
jgi:hypothetical protein